MDTLGNTIAKQLQKSGESSKEIVQPNIALQIAKMTPDGIIYPKQKSTADVHDANKWVYETTSSIRMDPIKRKGTCLCTVNQTKHILFYFKATCILKTSKLM